MDLEWLGTFKEYEGQPLIHLVQVQEEPNSCGTRGWCVWPNTSDTIQVRSNSDFDVKSASIQFYGNSHNSQSDCWIGLNFYMESPNMLSYLGLKFQIKQSLGRNRNTGQQRLYEFCYLLPFDLWTSYLARILFLKRCRSLFWESLNSPKIFNGLQHSFHVWQIFINVSESFSYKDSLFILVTKRKKDFKIKRNPFLTRFPYSS
jgi:hypothetical protein